MTGPIMAKGVSTVTGLAGKAVGAVAGNWLPWALGAALAAALVGGYFTLRSAWRAEGAARVEAADARAVADQQAKDAETSAKLLDGQRAYIAKLETAAAEAVRSIQNAPVTSGCGPSTDAAVDWLRGNAAGPGR